MTSANGVPAALRCFWCKNVLFCVVDQGLSVVDASTV